MEKVVIILVTSNTKIEIGENTAIGIGSRITTAGDPRNTETINKTLSLAGSFVWDIKVGNKL